MPDKVSPDYRTIVEDAKQDWIRKLTDRSKNNKLLCYKRRLSGTLDLSTDDPQAFNALLMGKQLPLNQLVPHLEAAGIASCLKPIRQRALQEEKERGLSTLFLAVGIATWTATDLKAPPTAPVLLIPVSIHGGTHLERKGEVRINPVLLQVLESEPQWLVKADILLGDFEEESPDPMQLLKHLEAAACRVPGFTIEKRHAVLSNFCVHKRAMVADLEAHSEVLTDRPVIALLASASESASSCSSNASEASPLEPCLVLQADSSQQQVIQAVLGDQPLTVIQGPPGTGKSQTIANLIAVLAAKGQRVLFVAQKRAALEAVQKDLRQVGLEYLLLDLHSNNSRHQVIQQFADSWDIVQRTPPLTPDTVQPQRDQKVQMLRQLSRRLHDQQPLTGKSVYAMQGELLHFAPEEQVSVRFLRKTLQALASAAATIEADLGEVSSDTEACRLFLGTLPSVWLQEARLPTESIAQQLFETVKQLLNEQWPVFRDALTALLTTSGLQPPETLHQVSEYLSLFESVNTALALKPKDPLPLALDLGLPSLEPALLDESSYQSMLAQFLARVKAVTHERSVIILSGLGPFAKAFSEWAKAVTPGRVFVESIVRPSAKASNKLLLKKLTTATEQARQWQSLSLLSSLQVEPCRTDAQSAVVRAQWHTLTAQLNFLQLHLKQPELHLLRFDDLLSYLKRLAGETTAPAKLVRVQAVVQKLDALGAGDMLAFWRKAQPEPQLWVRQFRYAWLRSHLEVALNEQPLPGFFEQTTAPPLQAVDWQAVESDIQALRQLSEQQRQTAIDRLCDAHAQRVITEMERYPEQEESVKAEIKKKRHKPLRPFFGKTFDVLTSLRPCWMMSPLSVSEFLDQRCQFDVVIFDEASQVRVEEAVPAILRGSQIVVAGDQAQLPPTAGFTAGRQHSESLLERLTTSGTTSHCLRWHYRSDDERLIAFANQAFYANRLITFPSACQKSPIAHFMVQQNSHQNLSESRQAFYVDVVKQLLQPENRVPADSLLITTGVNQTKLLERGLGPRSKKFLVKNLQSVQGDESDVVIWLLGYGKNRSGDLRHNFGSLLLKGGERHLNVATTRARKRMLVFSSFSHHDLKPEKCADPQAAILFKQYLEYVEQEQATGRTAPASEADLDDFETDVCQTLTARGLKLEPLVGASQARIRLAVVHPTRPERFVLAIETDGLHNQVLPDIQDRYLLWPEQLEKRGFQVHRLWSIDWFLHREAAIAQVVEAYQAAVALADQQDVDTLHSTRSAVPQSQRQPDKQRKCACGARPRFLKHKPAQNLDKDLAELLRWIEADGLRRTKYDLLEAMKAVMQEERCWKPIGKRDQQLREAIEQHRSQSTKKLVIPLERLELNRRSDRSPFY